MGMMPRGLGKPRYVDDGEEDINGGDEGLGKSGRESFGGLLEKRCSWFPEAR